MIAFAIAEDLAKMGDISKAIEWCEKAETLFPKEEFKAKARRLKSELMPRLNEFKSILDEQKIAASALVKETEKTIDNLRDLTTHSKPDECLFIVSCTNRLLKNSFS